MSVIDAPFSLSSAVLPIPPLSPGDRLSRKEFERRYEAMPDHRKAELIEGVVYLMASPLNSDHHGSPHANLISWLGHYRVFSAPEIMISDNPTVRLDQGNEPRPDAVLYVRPEAGGQVRLNQGYLEAAPELVAEVSSTTVSIDLHDKFRAYERNGVREYIVWRIHDRAIDWFVSRDGKFERLPLGDDGVYRSLAFPGLWLDPAALIRDDARRVWETQRHGLASAEHAQFMERLRRTAAARQP